MDAISTYTNDDRKVVRVTWKQLNSAIDILANHVRDKQFEAVYGVPRGGTVVAALLSYKLNTLLVFEKSKLTTLIVDDIEETSNTINNIKRYRNNKICVLFSKRKKGKADYYVKYINMDKHIKMPWNSH